MIVDRFALSLINRKVIKADVFDFNDRGVFLNREGRKVFMHHWQLNKKEELIHPWLQEKIPLGLIPYAQATILAKAVRNEIPEYSPFSRR